ncbi:MAG: hypothetical protein ACFBZ9_10490 [Sphingomonadales bacterium]
MRTAYFFLVTSLSSAFAPNIMAAEETLDSAPAFTLTPAVQTAPLSPEKLKVSGAAVASHDYGIRTLETWSGGFQTSYTLFDDSYSFIDVDVKVGLKPKRLMSLQANW